jgi:anti-anti-sigma factor
MLTSAMETGRYRRESRGRTVLSSNCHQAAGWPPHHAAMLACDSPAGGAFMPHPIPETIVVVTDPLEGDALPRWEMLIRDAAALHPERLVIDLRESPRIDPAAVVLLLQVHREVVCAGGELTLRAPAPDVREMLRVTRADQVLEIDAVAGGPGWACPTPRPHRPDPTIPPGQRRTVLLTERARG